MAEGTIEIGATNLDTPIGYTHDPKKLESDEYSIGGTLLTTRIVTAEDQPKNKYLFRVSGIINSKMYAIKAEVAHVGDLDYIDYLMIIEVLSGDGTEKTFYTQRQLNTKLDPVPVVTVDGGVLAEPAGYTATLDDAGRGKFVFVAAPNNDNNNIIIQYEPKYNVRIPEDGFTYIGRIQNIANYLLICKEV